MPVIPNPKHERFAQELAKGKTADEAYEAAGYAQNRGNATRLKANESIRKRLDELTGRAAERSVITLESLIQEAAAIQAAASEDRQHSAATAALIAKAKLAGMWIERMETENTNVNYAVGDEPPTDSEWESEHVTAH